MRFLLYAPFERLIGPDLSVPHDLSRLEDVELLSHEAGRLRMHRVGGSLELCLRLEHQIGERTLARDPLRLVRLVEKPAARERIFQTFGKRRRIVRR
ncbi:MAG: hypothetical protein ACXWUB_12150 [Burkholderiales bacterium]